MAVPRQNGIAEHPLTLYRPERDGVTNGLLGTWLACREKARLFLEGWTPMAHSFAITFGNVFHQMLEWVYDDVRNKKLQAIPGPKYLRRLDARVRDLWLDEHPAADAKATEFFELTMLIANAVVPLYFKYWFKTDFLKLRWEALEHQFRIPIKVEGPDGKLYETFMRGKMDGTFTNPTSLRNDAFRLFETKTKSRVDEDNLSRIMPIERQVNIYLSALRRLHGKRPGEVLYNVVRRPQLRQGVKETAEQFATRIANDVADRPDFYFFRLRMTVSKEDMDTFDHEFSQMVAEFLLWANGKGYHYKNSDACENKYGVCPFLGVCSGNNYTGLTKRTVIFRELEDIT